MSSLSAAAMADFDDFAGADAADCAATVVADTASANPNTAVITRIQTFRPISPPWNIQFYA
jgi:hypothetical protein